MCLSDVQLKAIRPNMHRLWLNKTGPLFLVSFLLACAFCGRCAMNHLKVWMAVEAETAQSPAELHNPCIGPFTKSTVAERGT
jgi:hypothetical protein